MILSIMSLSILILNIRTLSIMSLSILILNIRTLSIMSLSIMTSSIMTVIIQSVMNSIVILSKIYFTAMLSVIFPNAVLPNVV